MSNGVAGKEKCGLGLLLTQVLWGRWWLECPVLNTCGFLINSYSQGIRRLCSPITIRWHYALLDSVNHLQPVQSPQDHRYGSPEWDFFNIGHLEEKKNTQPFIGSVDKNKDTHKQKTRTEEQRRPWLSEPHCLVLSSLGWGLFPFQENAAYGGGDDNVFSNLICIGGLPFFSAPGRAKGIREGLGLNYGMGLIPSVSTPLCLKLRLFTAFLPTLSSEQNELFTGLSPPRLLHWESGAKFVLAISF